MHYTLFIITFRRNKLIAIVNWVFPSIKLFKIIYDVFYVCSNFIKVFFNWWCSVSITVTLIFDIIVTPNIFFFYWFVIIFFKLRKVPNISYYAIFDCLIFFFQSKKISYISKCIVIYFFFFFCNLERCLTSLIMLSSIFYLFQSLDFSSLYIVKKIN